MEEKVFFDNQNISVFTTRFVMKNNQLITYVTHEIEDGAWQFYSESEFNSFEDIMVVTIKNILELDQTINQIANLPLGYMATRESRNEKWKISKL